MEIKLEIEWDGNILSHRKASGEMELHCLYSYYSNHYHSLQSVRHTFYLTILQFFLVPLFSPFRHFSFTHFVLLFFSIYSHKWVENILQCSRWKLTIQLKKHKHFCRQNYSENGKVLQSSAISVDVLSLYSYFNGLATITIAKALRTHTFQWNKEGREKRAIDREGKYMKRK